MDPPITFALRKMETHIKGTIVSSMGWSDHVEQCVIFYDKPTIKQNTSLPILPPLDMSLSCLTSLPNTNNTLLDSYRHNCWEGGLCLKRNVWTTKYGVQWESGWTIKSSFFMVGWVRLQVSCLIGGQGQEASCPMGGRVTQ